MGELDGAGGLDGAELRRRADADADMARYDAERFVVEARREAERMMDRARARLVDADQRAIEIEREARSRAAEIVREAEQRAREVAAEIIVVARQWVSDVVERTPKPDSVLFVDERGGDVVIDLRTGTVDGVTVDDIVGPTPDQLDRIMHTAVQKAVRRAFRAPSVAAGVIRD